MTYELKPGQGSLFPSDQKTSPNQPDLTGRLCLPDGKVMRLAAWSKRTAAGKEWLSIQLDEERGFGGAPGTGSNPVNRDTGAPAPVAHPGFSNSPAPVLATDQEDEGDDFLPF